MKRVGCLLVAALLSLPARGDILSPSGRLRFVPGPGAVGLAQGLAKTADRDRAQVIRDVGRDFPGPTEVRVTLDQTSFRAALPKGASVPAWAVGVAFPDRDLVVLRATPGDPEARATLRHELSHVAVGRLTHGRVPRWFLEGLAMLREDTPWSDRGPNLAIAALLGKLYRFRDLSTGFPADENGAQLAYAESADFVSFLRARAGARALELLLRDVVAGQAFDAAVRTRLGQGLPALERQWRRSLARWELFAQLLTRSDLLFALLALLLIAVAVRLRTRKKRWIERQEAEERLERMRAFQAAPAVWADEPPPSADLRAAAADDAEVETDSESPAGGLAAGLFERDSASFADDESSEDEPGLAPKKPTLH